MIPGELVVVAILVVPSEDDVVPNGVVVSSGDVVPSLVVSVAAKQSGAYHSLLFFEDLSKILKTNTRIFQIFLRQLLRYTWYDLAILSINCLLGWEQKSTDMPPTVMGSVGSSG